MVYRTISPRIRNIHKTVCDLERYMKTLRIDRAELKLEALRQKLLGHEAAGSLLNNYAARVLICFAIAADFDESYLPVAKSILSDLARSPVLMLSVLDYRRISIADALIQFFEGKHDRARAMLESLVEDNSLSTLDADLKCTAYYYLARCYSRVGDFRNAIRLCGLAKEAELQVTGSKRVAVIEELEGYLLCNQDKIDDGLEVLERAKRVFDETADKINLAIVRTFQGQFCRRAGDYEGALEHFEAANEIFTKFTRSTVKPNRKKARCLLNISNVLRLMAARLEEERASERRLTERPSSEKGSAEQNRLTVMEKNYLARSRSCLTEAKAVYDKEPERFRRNFSRYHYFYALLLIEEGDFDEARRQAKSAYELAKEMRDKITMAKARIAQCIIALDQDKHGSVTARRFARDAVKFAEHTQYHRVMARAYVWLGKTLLKPPFPDPKSADECWFKAYESLAPSHKDYLRDELDSLRREIDSFDSQLASDFPARSIYTLPIDAIKERALEGHIQDLESSLVSHYMSLGMRQTQIADALRTTTKRIRGIQKRLIGSPARQDQSSTLGADWSYGASIT